MKSFFWKLIYLILVAFLMFLLSLLFLGPRVYAVSPLVSFAAQLAEKPAKEIKKDETIILKHYTQEEIDQMLEGTANPGFLSKIIKCESQNVNIARMDSNGQMSYGILQFNGTATWATFVALAGVSKYSSPMEPSSAIQVADYMITHGQIRRWTCAKLTGII